MTPIVLAIIAISLTFIITLEHGFRARKALGKKKAKKPLELKRSLHNPILKPRTEKSWESEATFNSGAIKLGEKIHLLYRAIGADGVSRFGHAESSDGVNVEERFPYAVFFMENPRSGANLDRRYDPVIYGSGGSWGGCEDPRLVSIDGRIYMTFNAFDGWDFIRVAATSISEEDFKNKKWNWRKPMLISPPGQVNKNWVLFPEKIKGKFAILHSLSPEVQIDYVNSLEELGAGAKKINSKFSQKTPRGEWDTWVRGAGPPPLKTKNGWLVFYHGIGRTDSGRYKLGMMLLDLKNPRKIVARSKAPVLLPDKWYENEGKRGIVYSCGAVLKEDKVYVYYGGGDKYVCVATSPLSEILGYLLANKSMPRFTRGF